jgi:hypothetical protein
MGGGGVRRWPPPTGVRSAEVPTALLHLLASLHVHLEGGVHAGTPVGVTGGGGARESCEWGDAGGALGDGHGGEGHGTGDVGARRVRRRNASIVELDEA